jgi:hypothetical protein
VIAEDSDLHEHHQIRSGRPQAGFSKNLEGPGFNGLELIAIRAHGQSRSVACTASWVSRGLFTANHLSDIQSVLTYKA